LPEKSISYPKVCKRYDGLYYIDFKLSNKRYRLFSGSKIGSSLSPNTYPLKLRRIKTIELANKVYNYLISNNYSFGKQLDNVGLFDGIVSKKLSEPLSKSYHKCLNNIASKLRNELLSKGNINVDFIDSISLRNSNNTSYNTTRRHVNVLVNYLYENGFKISKSKLKTRKQEEVLHKPIDDVRGLLESIKEFNYNLYLCALLTYGCLLRPHQEIRQLKWRDFSDDMSLIRLSGDRIKSKRNRIVPVPKYIRDILIKGDYNHNIFSGSNNAYNSSYFKGVWSRFKKVNLSSNNNITLYSFRHSGAIEIFKRTGSITKLQKAMGHSSINVSLTYLRGLEIAELKEEDMPMV
tara:strand:+ start:875 stop:1921 length:1047 start_codon:yes stop_codon:yes gene_type:complete